MKFAHELSLCLMIAVLCVVWAQGAHAWESDVHYGLVKWLAVHAGFSVDDAEIVAAGSEAPDETSVLSATGVSELVICNPFASADVEASRHVQRYHFPSGGYTPALPGDRIVAPGRFQHSTIANRWIRQEIKVSWDPADVKKKSVLNSLGTSLHALADSWSHQGKPGIPIPWVCPEKTAWGHPDARGGPRSHYADVTFRHPKDTYETAETVYTFLAKFLDANPGRFSGGIRKSFQDFDTDVTEFAEAKTKTEKYEWLAAQDSVVPYDKFTTYPCFLKSISIPIGRGDHIPCASDAGEGRRVETKMGVNVPVSVPEAERDVRNFVDDMLKAWIVDRTYKVVVDKFLAVESVRSNLLGDRASAVIAANGPDWDMTLLSMWLVADHGAVSEFGHGLPNNDGFVPLVKQIPDLPKVETFESASQAIRSASGTTAYDLSPITAGTDYAVSFKFRHVPNDVLYLRATLTDQGWRITALDWTTD